jgi:hypothetical protein
MMLAACEALTWIFASEALSWQNNNFLFFYFKKIWVWVGDLVWL